MVRETIQKKSESARVAQSTIMSVIILEYSCISTSLSESILRYRYRDIGQNTESLQVMMGLHTSNYCEFEVGNKNMKEVTVFWNKTVLVCGK